jgi:hypothetical protein
MAPPIDSCGIRASPEYFTAARTNLALRTLCSLRVADQFFTRRCPHSLQDQETFTGPRRLCSPLARNARRACRLHNFSSGRRSPPGMSLRTTTTPNSSSFGIYFQSISFEFFIGHPSFIKNPSKEEGQNSFLFKDISVA